MDTIEPSLRRGRARLRISGDVWRGLVLGVLGFITFLPIILLFELSFKSEQMMAESMWLPALPLRVRNYYYAWVFMARPMLNSIVYVIGTLVVSITASVLSAYVLARYSYPGRELLFLAILGLMMIPGVLTLITRFAVVLKLRLNNTYWGVWLPLAAAAQAFQIIVLRTFFESVPEELFEAGRLDGAGEFRMLVYIALPMAKPILTTLIVLLTDSVWNEFIWPVMVMSNPKLYPTVLAILALRDEWYRDADTGAAYAAYAIAAIPMFILFAFSSRAFIRGLTSGAIKM